MLSLLQFDISVIFIPILRFYRAYNRTFREEVPNSRQQCWGILWEGGRGISLIVGMLKSKRKWKNKVQS